MKFTNFLVLAGVLAVAACKPTGSGSTAAPDAKPAGPPVATIDGTPISRDFYDFYVKAVSGKAASELTPEQRSELLDNLIRAKIVGQQAIKDGVDKDGDTATILELSRLQLLRQAVSQKYLKDKKPTDADLRAEYETQVAAMPKTEYHAEHILVPTEAQATQIIEKLKKGADFADLAKKESIDPSGKQNGGDLNWFTPNNMVKPFSTAVMGMKKGEITQTPVQTQYGWHVIKLLDTRETTPPPFDAVKDRLGQLVLSKKFKSYEDDLLKTAKVEKTL